MIDSSVAVLTRHRGSQSRSTTVNNCANALRNMHEHGSVFTLLFKHEFGHTFHWLLRFHKADVISHGVYERWSLQAL